MPIKSILYLVLLCAGFSTMIYAQQPPLENGVSQTLARWRAANYSDVRYKLNITLEKKAPLMTGDIEISVKLTDEGAKNDLVLDWRTTQFQKDKDKPFADVTEVNKSVVKETAPDGVFDYQTNKEHLIVSKKYLKTGDNTIKIKFASPIKTSGSAITRYIDKEDGAEYVYSLFVPSDASTAFPVFDQPDLKARFEMQIDVPKEWDVVSNERRLGTNTVANSSHSTPIPIKEGLRRHYFAPVLTPISTYLIAFAAGEFTKFNECDYWKDENPLCYSTVFGDKFKTSKIYVRKSQAEKFKQHAAEVFRLNREGVKFLEDYFDYKFPFPKYDLVLIPEFPFGGMEHAGATFLRESSVIFPTEPTKNDYVSRANVIFHEAAHQWFGDTVTMKWFDDLWLKEGFAEFMAYKTLERVMPEYNAWKIFYERNKQAAYLTDSTRGTTPIYQEIPNLSAAKSAYGNIVYRKAPSFLKQAEFYLGEKEFQTAVRAFLKNHQYANAEWTNLVKEFGDVQVAELKTRDYYQKLLSAEEKKSAESKTKKETNDWANDWVKTRGVFKFILKREPFAKDEINGEKFSTGDFTLTPTYKTDFPENSNVTLSTKFKALIIYRDGTRSVETFETVSDKIFDDNQVLIKKDTVAIIPNYQDYGYGIFLLDEKSRAYVLENIQTEKDDFLRAMMWGSLWDSVRETELAPEDYVRLVIKNINVETDESTIQTLLGRVSTAMNYYIGSVPPAVAGREGADRRDAEVNPSAIADGSDLRAAVEKLLLEKMRIAPTVGQKITFYRAFLNAASSENARTFLKDILSGKSPLKDVQLKTKDKFDIVTRLLILGDKDAPRLLAELEKTETSDEAKRYAYAAKAGIATAENKVKFWNDFVNNKEISESWIESAFGSFNSIRHSELTLPYLEKALAELPSLKRNRKIFFVNGWLSAFIGGQKSEEALKIVNKFLETNPNLDRDLRLKILENADGLERAVKIRAKYGK